MTSAGVDAFQGVDALLIGWATQHFGVRFALDTPADLADVVPLVQVQTIGGPSDVNLSDLVAATVSFDSFGADYAAAEQLAWRVDAGLHQALPGVIVNGTTFTRVRTLSIPGRRPWNDINVRRYGSTCQVWFRKPSQ